MFTGEYSEKLDNGRVHFPFDKDLLRGWHCYLLEYEDASNRFVTIAESDSECLDGDVKIAGKLPLLFDGDMMIFDDAILNHISLDGDTVVFCGTGRFIDIMSEEEFNKSLEFMDIGNILKFSFEGDVLWKE